MVLTGIPFIDCIILFHMIFFSYFANNPAWISGSQTIWRNVPCHNTSCSYYTSLSYGNTTTNNHIGCQPAIIFYSNWRESERKKLWETNSRRSEIYKESISFLIWHLKDSQCPGLSAQSAFLGQVLTHSIHKMHSVPFSGVIGYINIHLTNFFTFSTWNTLLFVTLNSGCREITHRLQKNCDRTNILTKRSVIFESECQNDPHNIIQNIPHNKSYKHDFLHILYVIQKK